MPYPPQPDDCDNIMRAFVRDMQSSLNLPEGSGRDFVQLGIVRAYLARLERLERWLREYGVEDVDRYTLSTLDMKHDFEEAQGNNHLQE